jgi:hypothetical protein
MFFNKKVSLKKTLIATTAINSLTHPIVFFILMNLKQTYFQNIIIAEFFAVSAETVFFFYFLRISLLKSFLAATVANLISWQLAPIITYIVLKT